jgi:hypothetical protein
MKGWRVMGRFRSGSRVLGPVAVVLAITVGATLPLVLGTTGPAGATRAATSACGVTPTTTGTVVPVAADSPPCSPTLTVTPNAELADGQTVTLAGSGFGANQVIGMTECEASATTVNDCDLNLVIETDSDSTGAFTIPYDVTRDITVNGTAIDCATSSCIMGSANISNFSQIAVAAISFNPNIPPVLTGTISPTDKVETKTGTAYITGTVACTQPLAVEVDVTLAQVFHRRFNNTNSSFVGVQCNGRKKGAKWKVEIPPGFAYYGPGKATVQVQLSSLLGNSFRTFALSAGVKLIAS